MYRCECCSQVQSAGTPSVTLPIQTRARTYPKREDAQPGLPRRGKNGRKIPRKYLEPRDDPGGQGREIVREQRCCPACAARWWTQKAGKTMVAAPPEGIAVYCTVTRGTWSPEKLH